MAKKLTPYIDLNGKGRWANDWEGTKIPKKIKRAFKKSARNATKKLIASYFR